MNRRSLLLAALLGSAALGQGTDQPAKRYGVVSVTRFSLQVPGMAGALVTPSALFARQALGGASPKASGTCQVSAGAPGGDGVPTGGPAGGQGSLPDSLDAGDPITIAGPDGPVATLQRVGLGATVSYRPQGASVGLAALARPFPANATVDIPGAAGDGGFPAFKAAALPGAPALSVSAPEDLDAFTPDQTIRWNGAGGDGLVVFTGSDDDAKASFVCTAPDSGSFNLPAATQAELKARGFTQGSLSALRTVSRVLRQGDAQLTLTLVDIAGGRPPGR